MRILLTNDDGIHAEGLRVLEKIAHQLSDDVWTVAPETDQSGMAHSLTLTNPLRMRKIAEKQYCVRGTPTDCVMMAIKHIMPHAPDLVLSGVNIGGNLANDITYSGTVAGAMEGSLQGITSLALSQEFRSEDGRQAIYWQTAEQFAPRIIKQIVSLKNHQGGLYNINFPPCAPAHVRGTKIAALGKVSHIVKIDQRVDGRGLEYYWMHFQRGNEESETDSDMKAIRDNFIAICPLQLDLTDYKMKETLENLIKEAKL